METRSTYLGTQSDYHTHAHDLPPQMGGCYSNNRIEATSNANLVDSVHVGIPEVSHKEPEHCLKEAMLRMIE